LGAFYLTSFVVCERFLRFLQPWQASRNVVLTLSFNVFMPPDVCAVCMVFRAQIRKNRWKTYKKCRPCVLLDI